MAQLCPTQELTEAIPSDYDDNIFMYETANLVIKPEKGVKSTCFQNEQNLTYFDLSSQNVKFTKFETEPENNMLSWTQKHPEHWTSLEVLDWIYCVAEIRGVDLVGLRGEAFQNISGPELCMMTRQDFIDRDPRYGNCFHDMFRQLFDDAKFVEPFCPEYFTGNDFAYPQQSLTESSLLEEDMDFSDAQTNRMLDNNLNLVVNDKEVKVCLDGEHWYDIDFNELSKVAIAEPFMSTSDDGGYGSAESVCGSEASRDGIGRLYSTDSYVFSDEESVPQTPTTPTVQTPKQRKSTARRRMTSGGSDEGCEMEDKKNNRGRKLGQASKGNHLWEFIRDLLKDTQFNPNLLRWEDKSAGVFRFVQSEAVAQMWGRKKNNPGMTYEKLSRAMRFCRTAGYFANIPKTGKFPKKLCFCFGPKATGWEDKLLSDNA